MSKAEVQRKEAQMAALDTAGKPYVTDAEPVTLGEGQRVNIDDRQFVIVSINLPVDGNVMDGGAITLGPMPEDIPEVSDDDE